MASHLISRLRLLAQFRANISISQTLSGNMVRESRTLHTSTCRGKRNHYFIPAYPKDDPVRDEPRTELIESKEDFKYVERLLPSMQVPAVPNHTQYPTPSGWSPPSGAASDLPYSVSRTRFHQIPVFTETKKMTQHWTLVKNIKGDIWFMAEDLRKHLEEQQGRDIPVTINEVSMKVRYKGLYEDQVKQWLTEKGF
ncbi:39S ribosomal protein L49, mitochondrial [Strongylocentrotus purpuratus]|uniref:Large ribosomal subunit protein mL49 n=1 Tax=Strongylocentrotus purpuratus TaxID=7668 RepID=A0A7M7RFA6_STRPU|nr:39S ribosomal protein L49, mitochondrial [Strongylocentrotus purpuratus]|eukprot:XP_797620.2 PREDICTED: 39S ribosomal protein L49, mitochondrial [Strongylocentrotus purpuratus]